MTKNRFDVCWSVTRRKEEKQPTLVPERLRLSSREALSLLIPKAEEMYHNKEFVYDNVLGYILLPDYKNKNSDPYIAPFVTEMLCQKIQGDPCEILYQLGSSASKINNAQRFATCQLTRHGDWRIMSVILHSDEPCWAIWERLNDHDVRLVGTDKGVYDPDAWLEKRGEEE